MKKIDLTNDMFPTKITFVYGANNYRKFVKKEYGVDSVLNTTGTTLILTEQKDCKHDIVIGVRKLKNIYQLKAVVVHELSHAVSEIVSNFGSECDEVRSYMLQRFYQDVMVVLDQWIKKGNNMACKKKPISPKKK